VYYSFSSLSVIDLWCIDALQRTADCELDIVPFCSQPVCFISLVWQCQSVQTPQASLWAFRGEICGVRGSNGFLWWQSWIFSVITPVFSVTWSFRKHSNMLICYSRNSIIHWWIQISE